MRNISVCTLLVVALFYTQNANCQNFTRAQLESKIDALIPAQVKDTTPGLVVGIVQKGELIFSKGYGLANLAYGIPNDPKMVYNLGSVSKQFLGYAFAFLHVKGDLNIDDPVSKYMDNWPEFEHKVTLRHLLTHTSGYREAYTMSNLAGREIGIDRLTEEECLNVVRKQPELEFVPGSRWIYNSTAWVILAEVLKKVTGQPADKWVEENIFKPLKMSSTQIESYVGDVIINAAESYNFDKNRGYINSKSNRSIFGAADVNASVEDLFKWLNNYRSAELGGKAVNDLFLAPYILSNGNNSEYALGIGNNSYRGLRRYRHTGGHEAFLTQLSYYPDQDLGIITISNFGVSGWFSTEKIADLLLKDQMNSASPEKIKSIKIKKEKLEEFAGLYVSDDFDNYYELTVKEDTLQSNRSKYIPLSPNTFDIMGRNTKVKFHIQPGGATQSTIVDQTGTWKYTKAEKWNSISSLREYEGEYWSDELETIYHLTINDNKITIQHRWFGELPIEAVSKDFFKSPVGIYVKFNRDKEGNILSLSINSPRTKNVVFQRKL